MSDDIRSLKSDFPEPCLAVVIVPTSEGPKIPVVFREKGQDQWFDLPGGKPKIGEDPFDAIEFECLEELNTIVSAHAYLGSAEHPKAGMPRRHFIAAAYVSGEPINNVPNEHISMELMSPQDAVNVLRPRVPEAVQDYILKAASLYEKNHTGPRLQVAPV